MEKRGIKGENHVKVEGLENLTPGEGVSINEDTKYEYGATLETEGTPLIDPGTGQTVALRLFDFAIDPSKLKYFPKDKQQIFSDHSRLIKASLWGDGLVPYEGASPRIVIDLKKKTFKIIVAAVARLNTIFMESPKSLTTMLASKASKNGSSRH